MKLILNGRKLTVPTTAESKIAGLLLAQGTTEYHKLAKQWRVCMMPISRAILGWFEKYMRDHFDKETALQFRPERGEDPNLFLAKKLSEMLGAGLQYVEVTLTTDEREVTSFDVSLEGSSITGGQVDSDGDIRIGQNHRLEIS